MKTIRRTLAIGLVLLGYGALAHGGIVISSGQTPVFGRQTAYREWSVYTDPVGPGQSSSTSTNCDVRSMVFHDGSLYVGSTSTVGAVGPTRYQPGLTGDLSTPTSINFAFSFPADRPQSGLNTRRLAINSSGNGFGGFAPGSPPTLVAISVASQEPLNPGDSYYTIRQTAPTGTISSPISPTGGPFRPTAFSYSPSLDRFITVSTSSQPPAWDDQGPGIGPTTIRFHAHNANGIDFLAAASFNIDNTGIMFIRGISPVPGSFASTLLGQSVADAEVLLTLARFEDGRSDPNSLRVYTLTGQLLGTSVITLPALNDPFGSVSRPSSLAVDSSSGVIYIGEQIEGRIVALQVPGPGTIAALFGLGVAMSSRRQRRATS